MFLRILQRSAFLTEASCGPVHRDLWKCITIPCLAVVATNVSLFLLFVYMLIILTFKVERVLMELQAGDSVPIKFTTKNFRKKYLSHVLSLVELYKLDATRLRGLLSRMAKELMYVFYLFTRTKLT